MERLFYLFEDFIVDTVFRKFSFWPVRAKSLESLVYYLNFLNSATARWQTLNRSPAGCIAKHCFSFNFFYKLLRNRIIALIFATD
jgi:hypothetical protein